MCESPDTKRLQFYDADDVSLNTLLAAMAPSDRRCPHVSEGRLALLCHCCCCPMVRWSDAWGRSTRRLSLRAGSCHLARLVHPCTKQLP